LWLQALLQVENHPKVAGDFERRILTLEDLTRNLMLGSPSAALPFLLALKQPPPAPNVSYFIVPGPSVPEYTLAGMNERDYLLALALGEELASEPAVYGKQVSAIIAADIRCLALSMAVQRGERIDLELKLEWCEAAASAANQVEPGYLGCLFKAEVAKAFKSAGVNQKAQNLAYEVANQVLISGQGSILQAAYAHALGRCLQIIVKEQNKEEALQLVWRAQALSNDGLYMVLSYLPGIIHLIDPPGLRHLQQAETEAVILFS
jgi:hypothetical protein